MHLKYNKIPSHIVDIFEQVNMLYTLQDLVGENHTWDLVFVDFPSMEKRIAAVDRLLKRTKLLIIHDTDFSFNNQMKLPNDFM